MEGRDGVGEAALGHDPGRELREAEHLEDVFGGRYDPEFAPERGILLLGTLQHLHPRRAEVAHSAHVEEHRPLAFAQQPVEHVGKLLRGGTVEPARQPDDGALAIVRGGDVHCVLVLLAASL